MLLPNPTAVHFSKIAGLEILLMGLVCLFSSLIILIFLCISTFMSNLISKRNRNGVPGFPTENLGFEAAIRMGEASELQISARCCSLYV
jgi:Na+-transporting methylmalonyl-CoA/oxaloacetate decarboxylase gamma subunit